MSITNYLTFGCFQQRKNAVSSNRLPAWGVVDPEQPNVGFTSYAKAQVSMTLLINISIKLYHKYTCQIITTGFDQLTSYSRRNGMRSTQFRSVRPFISGVLTKSISKLSNLSTEGHTSGTALTRNWFQNVALREWMIQLAMSRLIGLL